MNNQSKSKNAVKTQVFNKVVLPVIEGTKDVFISYKRENAHYVSRLCDELENHDIKTWFDMNELHQNVGKKYTERIHAGIKAL